MVVIKKEWRSDDEQKTIFMMRSSRVRKGLQVPAVDIVLLISALISERIGDLQESEWSSLCEWCGEGRSTRTHNVDLSKSGNQQIVNFWWRTQICVSLSVVFLCVENVQDTHLGSLCSLRRGSGHRERQSLVMKIIVTSSRKGLRWPEDLQCYMLFLTFVCHLNS